MSVSEQAESQPASIENALAETEAAAVQALKAAASVQSELKKYRTAAQLGRLGELPAAMANVRNALTALSETVEAVDVSWEFDAGDYLASGDYTTEIIERARAAGLLISELDGRLYCYPSLLRVNADPPAVLIDKTRERRLRPSVLVRLLQDMQRKPPRFKPSDFLRSLYEAYRIETESRTRPRNAGSVVPLENIYKLLTMKPGDKREYSKQEFARDVYLLDRSNERETLDGSQLEFHAGSSAAHSRAALSIVTQQGVEKKYHGIRFIPARSAE